MLAGPAAYAIIKHYEELRLDSYLDSKGVSTIGYGHTGGDVQHPMTITVEEAIRMLSDDIQFVEHKLHRMIKREPIAQHQFDALVSFTFNIGVVRFAKSTLLEMFNFSLDKEAANEFLRWNSVKTRAKSVKLKGLIKRRNTERELFISGSLDI